MNSVHAVSEEGCGYSSLTGSYYDSLKMNESERKRARQIARERRPMYLEPKHPDDMLRIRSFVEDSHLSEREKIALLKGFESFGKHRGVIRINPNELPHHTIYQLQGRYYPFISLRSLEDLGEQVSIHELDHFKALRDVVSRIMRRGGISQDQAYAKLNKLRSDDPYWEGLVASWLEDRALRAERAISSEYYPHTEKMRRWASDPYFVRRASVPGSSSRDRLIEAVKELAAATDPRIRESMSDGERWKHLQSPGLYDFAFLVKFHWTTPDELRLLEVIKDIFNREIRGWRWAQYRKSVLRHPPDESIIMEERLALSEDPHFGVGRDYGSSRELLKAAEPLPQLSRVISNYGQKPVAEYLSELRTHLREKTFPNLPERVEELLPKLAEGIFWAPDLLEKAGKNAVVDQAILQRLQESSPVSEEVIAKFAKSPLAEQYLARGDQYNIRFPRLRVFHGAGRNVRSLFWRRFEYFLRTEDPVEVVAFAKSLNTNWRKKAKEILILDLKGRSEKDFEWVFGGWKRRYEQKFQDKDNRKVVRRLLDDVYREAKE